MGRTKKSLLLVIIIGLGLFFTIHQSESKREAKKSETKIYDFHIKASELGTLKEFNNKYEVKNVKNDEVGEIKRPYIPNIPMSDDKLNYLFKRTNEENLSYELLLSIFMLESEQGTKKIHYNDDGSIDRGIFMINSRSMSDLAKEAGLKNYDPFNDYVSMELAIQHLKDSRSYWIGKGMSEEQAYPYIIVTFNRGLGGARAYLKHHDVEDNKYYQVVRNYKLKFEKTEVQN